MLKITSNFPLMDAITNCYLTKTGHKRGQKGGQNGSNSAKFITFQTKCNFLGKVEVTIGIDLLYYMHKKADAK